MTNLDSRIEQLEARIKRLETELGINSEYDAWMINNFLTPISLRPDIADMTGLINTKDLLIEVRDFITLDNYIQEGEACDLDGNFCYHSSPKAVKWSLEGALAKIGGIGLELYMLDEAPRRFNKPFGFLRNVTYEQAEVILNNMIESLGTQLEDPFNKVWDRRVIRGETVSA